jgi:hypothetical protein
VSRYAWRKSTIPMSDDPNAPPAYELVDTHNDLVEAMIIRDNEPYQLFFFSRRHMSGGSLYFDTVEQAQSVGLSIVTLT